VTDHPTQPATPALPAPTLLQAAIPNALSTARLIAAGVVIALLGSLEPLSPIRLLLAAGLFVAAALTDALDGYLARRWNAISRYGRIVDPLADKLLVLGAFVCLAGPAFARTHIDGPWHESGVTPAIACIILARELLVTSLRGLVESTGGDFSASLSGKLKMILQCVTVPLVLIVLATIGATPGSIGRTIVLWSVWTTTAVTAFSAVPYILRAMQYTKTNPKANPKAKQG